MQTIICVRVTKTIKSTMVDFEDHCHYFTTSREAAEFCADVYFKSKAKGYALRGLTCECFMGENKQYYIHVETSTTELTDEIMEVLEWKKNRNELIELNKEITQKMREFNELQEIAVSSKAHLKDAEEFEMYMYDKYGAEQARCELASNQRYELEKAYTKAELAARRFKENILYPLFDKQIELENKVKNI